MREAECLLIWILNKMEEVKAAYWESIKELGVVVEDKVEDTEAPDTMDENKEEKEDPNPVAA